MVNRKSVSNRGISINIEPVRSSQYSGKNPSSFLIPSVRSAIDGMAAGRCACCAAAGTAAASHTAIRNTQCLNIITPRAGILPRRHGWTVILGGPESANYTREYLDAGALVIVVGEGELTLADLLPALAQRGPHRLHEVNGIAFRDEAGAIVRTAARDAGWGDRVATIIDPFGYIWALATIERELTAEEFNARGNIQLVEAA